MLLCTLHKAKNINCVHPFLTICFPECSFRFCALDKCDRYLFFHVFNPFSNALCLFSFSTKYKMYLPITGSEIKPLQIEGNNSNQGEMKALGLILEQSWQSITFWHGISSPKQLLTFYSYFYINCAKYWSICRIYISIYLISELNC